MQRHELFVMGRQHLDQRRGARRLVAVQGNATGTGIRRQGGGNFGAGTITSTAPAAMGSGAGRRTGAKCV